jgi:acyl carrier protein
MDRWYMVRFPDTTAEQMGVVGGLVTFVLSDDDLFRD